MAGGRTTRLTKKKVKDDCLKAIKSKKLIFISEIVGFVPFVRATIYNYKIHEDEDILLALENNRINIKHKLRSKWYNSDNATLNIAAYKLAATDEERAILNQNNLDVTTNGKDIKDDGVSKIEIIMGDVKEDEEDNE